MDKNFLKFFYVLHVYNSEKNKDHFIYNGQRYVQCDNCGDIVPTSECQYYGGEGDRMFKGGCRLCFGGKR